MIRKLKTLLFLLLVLSSFKSPPYCKMVSRVVSKYSKELRKTDELRLYGRGGELMNSVEVVYAMYEVDKKLNIDQARDLYIRIMEGYIDRFNSNEQIRPYLSNYPFTYKNMDVMLTARDRCGNRIGDGYVTLVFYNTLHNIIQYESYNFETCSFYTIHKEPYEEALRIVTQDCPK